MKKVIKTGDDKLGVAKQTQGHVVEAIPHPRFEGLWQFELFGEKWMASDYAFVEE